MHMYCVVNLACSWCMFETDDKPAPTIAWCRFYNNEERRRQRCFAQTVGKLGSRANENQNRRPGAQQSNTGQLR